MDEYNETYDWFDTPYDEYGETVDYDGIQMTVNYRFGSDGEWQEYEDDTWVTVSDKASVMEVRLDIDGTVGSGCYMYYCDSDWISAEPRKGALRLTVDRNHSQNDRSATIMFTVPKDNTFVRKMYITQSGEEYLVSFGDAEFGYDEEESPRSVHLPPKNEIGDNGEYDAFILTVPLTVKGGRREFVTTISKMRLDTVFEEEYGEEVSRTQWTPVVDDRSVVLDSTVMDGDDADEGIRFYTLTLKAFGNLDTLAPSVRYAYKVKAVHKDNARFVFDEFMVDYNATDGETGNMTQAKDMTTDIPVKTQEELTQFHENAVAEVQERQKIKKATLPEYLSVDMGEWNGELNDGECHVVNVMTCQQLNPSVSATGGFLSFEWGTVVVSDEDVEISGKTYQKFSHPLTISVAGGVTPVDRTSKVTLSSPTYPTLFKEFYVTWKGSSDI